VGSVISTFANAIAMGVVFLLLFSPPLGEEGIEVVFCLDGLSFVLGAS